jgi:urease accessory protein
MHQLSSVLVGAGPGTTDASITLSFEKRRRSRLRTQLDGGEDVALVLPRGTVLKDGDVLLVDDGRHVRVNAAPESLSRATSDDARLLARAAYHMGNRHVPVQVGHGHLAYQHDHVLDDMLRRLGLTVVVVDAPFEPESGAYGNGHGHGGHGRSGGGHEHDHGQGTHEHDHDQGTHEHDHAYEHPDGAPHQGGVR